MAIKDIYPVLVSQMDKIIELEDLKDSGIIGVSWASSGGESAAILRERHLAADGIENVIKVLEELEDEKLNDLEFIELNACRGGCVGTLQECIYADGCCALDYGPCSLLLVAVFGFLVLLG